MHAGLVSSHFRRFSLQFLHPVTAISGCPVADTGLKIRHLFSLDSPSRLFVCLGFVGPDSFFTYGLRVLVAEGFLLGVAWTETVGEGADWMTGESRKAEGEGIVTVAMKVWANQQRQAGDTAVLKGIEDEVRRIMIKCGGGFGCIGQRRVVCDEGAFSLGDMVILPPAVAASCGC